ncbi:MAG: replicative DNA helicase [Clostridia bacterium]|nr:replicative DNA helicase [Clostridia bacterium]
MADFDLGSSYSSVKLPYSPEAEQAVLGAVIIDSECMARVAEVLPRADYFHIELHKLIYQAMLDLFTEGKIIDFVTLLEKLKSEKSFDETTGKTYLVQLGQGALSTENVEVHAQFVRDKYDVRMLIEASRKTIEEAAEGSLESDTLVDSAEQRIFDIRQGKNIQGLQHIAEVIQETYDRLDLLNSADNDEMKPLSTGIRGLDNLITGLNKSDLILLAARPGMGKTSFALNIARSVSVTQRKKVAFFSLEMSKEQLASRLLSTEGMIESQKIKTGKMSEDEWSRLIQAGDVLSGAELYLDDTPSITVPAMKAKLRRLKGVQLVVIDYLQLMQSGRRIDNRVQEVSDITRNLKILAKELDVPVITLSQLSRASEQRADHRPQLSDMRDSGSIEQDADIVLFLYRPDYYNDNTENAENEDKNSGECIVAKNRHGEMGTVDLHWRGEFMRFTAKEVIDVQ